MKILRVRRGFTTNSSASSEWIPPPEASPAAQPSGPFQPTTKVVLPMQTGQQSGFSWSDAAKGGGLIGVVALAFVAERVARMMRGKKKQENEDDAD